MEEIALHDYSLIVNGARRLALALKEMDTEWLRKKNFQRLLTWLTEDKDRMLCFLEGGEFEARKNEKKQLIPLRITPGSLNDILPDIDPEEHRFRKMCEVLMDVLDGMCKTVSLMTGRDSNEIFNDALRKGEMDIETTSDTITIHLNETKEEQRSKTAAERMTAYTVDSETDNTGSSETNNVSEKPADSETKAPKHKGRKFIMVQMPEPCAPDSEAYKAGYKNLCEFGKERIRRAAKKIKEETGADIDYGFRVLRCESCNESESKTDEEEFFKTMLDLGIPLSTQIEKRNIEGYEWRIAEHEGRALYACYNGNVSENSVRAVIGLNPAWIAAPKRPEIDELLKAEFDVEKDEAED